MTFLSFIKVKFQIYATVKKLYWRQQHFPRDAECSKIYRKSVLHLLNILYLQEVVTHFM